MFERTGFDMKFLADIHTIAISLKTIQDIQGLALVKIANDLGSLFKEKQAQQKLMFLKNYLSGCEPAVWADAEEKMNLVFRYEDPFEKEDENADEE